MKKRAKIDRTEYKCGAVVVAAGSGKRMGSDINKIFLEIDGVPIIAHALAALNDCKAISEIVLVTRECDIADCMRIVEDFGLKKVKTIIKGGKERQDSVYIGVSELSEDILYVAVHDGARPFITPELIGEVVASAIETKAAILAVPTKDTVKIADSNGFVLTTPDRASVWLAQTPQVFLKELLLSAFLLIKKQGIEVTDDCQMVERTGARVKLVMGSYDNIKITTIEDLVLAQAIYDTKELLKEDLF